MFQTLCTITADTSSICRNLAPKRHPVQNIYIGVNTVVTYYEIDFEIVLTLGKTEMTAHIAWVENVRTLHTRSILVNLFLFYTQQFIF